MSDLTNNIRGTVRPAATSPLGHRLLFIIFSFAAFLMFAPVVLLPMIKEHCDLLAEESRIARVNAELERELVRQDVLVKAFQEDAIINERLAVLDLHYNNPREETVAVLPPDFLLAPKESADELAFQSALRIPADWPPRIRAAEAWAEQRGLIDLFMEPTLRSVFLLMAGGLIVAAFVLFSPRVQPESSRVIDVRTSPPAGAPPTNGAALHFPS